jgi:MSHA biogenesis protein MshL
MPESSLHLTLQCRALARMVVGVGLTVARVAALSTRGWIVRRAFMSWVGASLVVSLLGACAGDLPRTALSEKPRVDKLAQMLPPSKAIGSGNEGDDLGSDVISTQGRSELIPNALDDSDPLPKHKVPWLSFVNTPLQDVLQAVIANAHVALAIVWDNPASKISRSSISMTHLTGDLTSVLNKLAESYGFYWRYKDGMLHIAADRQYIASIPPIADLFESLPIMVKTLGGTDVFLDKSARMITFRADSQAYFKINSYLDIMRKNRSLIVYDTYIWEVVLNDASKMGIDWGAMPGSVPATSITSSSGSAFLGATAPLSAGLVNASSGGTGLALSFAGSRFSMNVLIDFLRSQGTLNSLSQPKIQLLSGGKAALKDEIATTYVSRVGSSSISAGTVIPGSVETSQVKTGVTLEVSGDVSDGTIYSDIALRVSDLLGMGSATVSGSTIALPKTSSREVHTHVRAKPGDTILLAGIQYDKLLGALNTGMGILRSNQADVMRSELIIVMKPRIKHFVPKGEEDKAFAQPIAAARHKSVPVERPVPAPPMPSVAPPVTAPVVSPGERSPPVKQVTPKEIERISVPQSVQAVAEAIAAVERKKTTPYGESLSGVYLQLGAFRNMTNAENFLLDVENRIGWRRDAGQSLRVVSPAQANAGGLHRVLVGSFVNRQVAEKWAERSTKVVGGRPILVIR